ncbi:DNA double-strand break repair helicase HerA and related ATPase [Microdochium nivale]|nr:DNA double-strand break repair helicase HerA and related ATPase [Microdochium nivale]
MTLSSHFDQDGDPHDTENLYRASDIQRFLDYTTNADPNSTATEIAEKTQMDAFKNAPIFSVAAQTIAENLARRMPLGAQLVPQYGLLGSREDMAEGNQSVQEQLVMANLNIPWSAFICGSQGAGKSHTLSCLLEACLIKDNPTGTLSHPMAGLVFHYDRFTNSSTTQVCEAAHLASSGLPVRVLVTPSNVWNMDRIYGDLLGNAEHGPHVQVAPLYFDESQLNITTLLKLMAFDPSGSSTPLYMEVIIRIIREIAMEGSHFTYGQFKSRLSGTKLFPAQETALNMRLQLLDTFLTPQLTPKLRKPSACEQDIWAFQPGTLTIVDLSDPFLSADDACSLFSICLAIFLEKRANCGQVIALDEAHKFLTQSGAANVLTEDLTSVIRQQRHTGTRVFTATQEPTLSPKLIDLSNATFVHRFSSPAWYQTLKGHLAGATWTGGSASSQQEEDIFKSITELRTGEALMFCPTAQICAVREKDAVRLQSLAWRHLKVRIRKRLTSDGGVSIAATTIALPTRPAHQKGENPIKMHEPAKSSSASNANKTTSPSVPIPSNPLPAQKPGQAQATKQAPKKEVVNKPASNPVAGASIIPSLIAAQVSPVKPNATTAKPEATTTKPGASTAKPVATKAGSKALVNAKAREYASKLAQRESWNHATVLDQPRREAYLVAFKSTIEVQPQLCKATLVRMLFLGAIGEALAKSKTMGK